MFIYTFRGLLGQGVLAFHCGVLACLRREDRVGIIALNGFKISRFSSELTTEKKEKKKKGVPDIRRELGDHTQPGYVRPMRANTEGLSGARPQKGKHA